MSEVFLIYSERHGQSPYKYFILLKTPNNINILLLCVAETNQGSGRWIRTHNLNVQSHNNLKSSTLYE